MKSEKSEAILIVITLVAAIASIFLFDVPGIVLAETEYGSQQVTYNIKEYPKPHHTPKAPEKFPWNRMPDGHVPPPFEAPSPYPTPYPGPTGQ